LSRVRFPLVTQKCLQRTRLRRKYDDHRGNRHTAVGSEWLTKTLLFGGMAERLIAPVLKTGILERVSGVRIPVPPQIVRWRN
jgi:hypothetical protein